MGGNVDVGGGKVAVAVGGGRVAVAVSLGDGVQVGEADGKDGAAGGDSPIRIDVVNEYALEGLQNDVTYYVRISAVDDAGQESDLSSEVSGTPVTVQGLAGLTNEEGDCFVATAAFGDRDALEVHVFLTGPQPPSPGLDRVRQANLARSIGCFGVPWRCT